MSHRHQGFRGWVFLAVVPAVLVLAGLAIAQERDPETSTTGISQEEDTGPRWQRGDAEGWSPGDGGPPPWSNARWKRPDAEGWTPGNGRPPWASGEAEGDEEETEMDKGPRWQREDAEGWQPGDGGPPPWSNARWKRDDAQGWTPGDGQPPWAKGNAEDDAEDAETDKGPRWKRDDAQGWQPGDGGPPPWSNARWKRDDAQGWQPGDGGPPPWAKGKGEPDPEE